MPTKMQNPGGQAGGSLDQFCTVSPAFSTTSKLQAQFLACRFSLPPSIARDLARLCYGEGFND
jgi:hypothetical protein